MSVGVPSVPRSSGGTALRADAAVCAPKRGCTCIISTTRRARCLGNTPTARSSHYANNVIKEYIMKKEKVIKGIEDLAKYADSDSVFLGILVNNKTQQVRTMLGGKDADDTMSAALAAAVRAAVTEDGDEGAMRVAGILIQALRYVIAKGDDVSVKVAAEFQSTIAKGMERFLYGDDDEEDCENCKMNKTCDNPAAVRYRKEKEAN